MAAAMSAVVPSAVSPRDSSVAGVDVGEAPAAARLDQLAVDQQTRLAAHLGSRRLRRSVGHDQPSR